ncbi:MAG: hypothetical protein M2R45_04832 [Verrucomicrobia subdivision 3 bacterium]|nr:hypothetical protein [Limisphaerales bacterium]MCS1416653.1 hypothetical protein [Limisphaerales bacterium]
MNLEHHTGSRANLQERVNAAIAAIPVFDIHTHLYDPAFGSLLLYGIDDLLTYHYLVAEVFRYADLTYEAFWKLSKTEQADIIWDQLFIKHSPISEACRGVLTTLNKLGFDVKQRDLSVIRKWYAEQETGALVDKCLELANVNRICMTNSPFDTEERPVWEKGFDRDERFISGLRIDPLLLDWTNTASLLSQDGYSVTEPLNEPTLTAIRQFLAAWGKRFRAKYLMVSLPPTFTYPSNKPTTTILDQAVIPHCQEHGRPLALMIGVKRAVNPDLQLAGDGMGRTDLQSLENLCANHPNAKFLCTVLAKENQHELCVLARKFPNLHIFGCWWFTNVPYAMEEITRLRLELIGLSVTPQHSDARVLDQLIYKWSHSREIISRVLAEKYDDLTRTGWHVPDDEINRDVTDLLGGAFERFCKC